MNEPFKMKGFTPFTKKTDPYDRDENQTADYSGPVKPINKTVASKSRKQEHGELVADLEDKIEFVTRDIENGKVSEAEGKKIIAELQSKVNYIFSK